MAEEKVKELKGPGKGPRGPRPKLDHPMQTFLRIMCYLMKYYPVHMVIVVITIFAGVLCSVQGTWFMKDLIDVYVRPLLLAEHADFSGL